MNKKSAQIHDLFDAVKSKLDGVLAKDAKNELKVCLEGSKFLRKVAFLSQNFFR